jgi:hypothetical protein
VCVWGGGRESSVKCLGMDSVRVDVEHHIWASTDGLRDRHPTCTQDSGVCPDHRKGGRDERLGMLVPHSISVKPATCPLVMCRPPDTQSTKTRLALNPRGVGHAVLSANPILHTPCTSQSPVPGPGIKGNFPSSDRLRLIGNTWPL